MAMREKYGAVYPSLRGKTVLVTGGGSGIGAAIVRHFAAQGAKVGFVDILDVYVERHRRTAIRRGRTVGNFGPLALNHHHGWSDRDERVCNLPVSTRPADTFFGSKRGRAELDLRNWIEAEEPGDHGRRAVGNSFPIGHSPSLPPQPLYAAFTSAFLYESEAHPPRSRDARYSQGMAQNPPGIRQLTPPFPLSQFVDCFWIHAGYSQSHARERVLPTGTMDRGRTASAD